MAFEGENPVFNEGKTVFSYIHFLLLYFKQKRRQFQDQFKIENLFVFTYSFDLI